MKLSGPAVLLALSLSIAEGEVVALPYPAMPMPAGKTVVWSPLLQEGWDKLNENLERTERTEPANKLVANLDSFLWDSEKILPENYWKVWSGPSTRHFVKHVNEEAAILSGRKGLFEVREEGKRKFAVFCLFQGDVEFIKSFYKSVKTPMKFLTELGVKEVKFFGSRGELSGDYGELVRVLAWRPVDGSYAIQIPCTAAGESMILYQPPGDQDFETACHWVRAWIWRHDIPSKYGAWDDTNLHSGDELQIPYLRLKSMADFAPQLGGSRFPADQGEAWTVGHAEQAVSFNLNEKGTDDRAESDSPRPANDPFALPPPTIPRRFVYDRPFFVFLWKDRGTLPYFAAWIGDDSAMEVFR